MEIRPATNEDIDALCRLQRSVRGEAWPCAVWRDELEREQSSTWVVDVDGGTTVALLVTWRVLDVLEVADLVVAAEYRRRGIATALMATAASLAFVMGVRRIALEVREDDEGAYRFYRELGFVEVEFLSGFYDDGTGARRLVRHSLHRVAHSE